MAQSRGLAIENNFSKGLVTEASGISFPENAVSDSLNCRYESLPLTKRRLGLDYELDYEKFTSAETGLCQEFLWRTVSLEGSISFVVQRIGTKLYFFETAGASLSAGKATFEIDLTTYKSSVSVTSANIREFPVCFASGMGRLFLTHRFLEPLTLKYNISDNSLSAETIELKVRDTWGLDDSLDNSTRPSTLSAEHEYNLKNQGWYDGAYNWSGFTSPLAVWDNYRTDYPSNADVWWQYKNSSELMDMTFVDKFAVGNTRSPRGHFIYDAFNINRGVGDVETSGNYRPELCIFFAGRVWYFGVPVQGYSNRFFYSQLITQEEKFGVCYQRNDPTSETLFDLLATDGGVIDIPEIDTPIFGFTNASYLFIVCNNGVWTISGSEGTAFKPTDYATNKISGVPASSSFSLVDVDGLPFWWNNDGIYTVSTQNRQMTVQSLSEKTIHSFYKDLPALSKAYTKGTYNPITKEIIWLYRSEAPSAVDEYCRYDSYLVFNTETGGFSPQKISDDSTVDLRGIISLIGSGSETIEDTVVVSGDPVESDSELVGVYTSMNTPRSTVTKFFVSVGTSFTFAEEYNTDYVDWYSEDDEGVVFDSYFVSGYRVRGELARDYSTPYLYLLNKYDEDVGDLGYTVRGKWRYVKDETDKYTTSSQQGYRNLPNVSYGLTKLRIRGSGPVLQFRIDSQDNKGFFIAGWVTYDSVEGSPR